MDVSIKQVTKSFEQMGVFIEHVTKLFEWIDEHSLLNGNANFFGDDPSHSNRCKVIYSEQLGNRICILKMESCLIM